MTAKLYGDKKLNRLLFKGRKFVLSLLAILVLTTPIVSAASFAPAQSDIGQTTLVVQAQVIKIQELFSGNNSDEMALQAEGFSSSLESTSTVQGSQNGATNGSDTSEDTLLADEGASAGIVDIAPLYAGATDTVTTFSALQIAMTSGSPTRIIAMSNDITLDNTITIPAGRDITLVSTGTTSLQTGVGAPRNTLFAPLGEDISNPIPQGGSIAANAGFAARSAVNGPRHITVEGGSTLSLVNIAICGSNRSNFAGGVQVSGTATTPSQLNMRGNSSIQNNQQVFGGGLFAYNAVLSMSSNAYIANNSATADFDSDAVGFSHLPASFDPAGNTNRGRHVSAALGNHTVLGGGAFLMNSNTQMSDNAQIVDNEVSLTFSNSHAVTPLPPVNSPGGGANAAPLPAAPLAYEIRHCGSGGGAYVCGGQFSMQDNARISDNDTDNHAANNALGMRLEIHHVGVGGGIVLRNGATLDMVHDAAISNNETSWSVVRNDPPGQLWDMAERQWWIENRRVVSHTWIGNGGGVAMFDSGTVLNMNNETRISRNRAQVAGGVNGGGGGVFVYGGATLNMYDTAVIGGTSSADENSFTGGTGSGAGLFIFNSFANMNDDTHIAFNHTRNTASGGGVNVGGEHSILTMNNNSFIKENTAGSGGGGIHLNAGQVIMNDDAVVEANRLITGNTGGAGINVLNGRLTMNDLASVRYHRTSAFTTNLPNTAPVLGAAGVRVAHALGRVYMNDDARIHSNNVGGNGAGVWMNAGTFTMNNGSIDDNTAGNTANLGGAGVFLEGSATFHMHDGEITNNRVGNAASALGGGGVFMQGNSSFNLNADAVIHDNTVAVTTGTIGLRDNQGGAGVFMQGNSTFNMGSATVDGGTIRDNTLGRTGAGIATGTNTGGGGVRMQAGTFNMNGGSISSHGQTPAPPIQYGGGVRIQGGTFTMNDAAARIEDNRASRNGGGVFVNAGNFHIHNGSIEDNVATTHGGGVFMNAGAATMSSGAIADNGATNGGGIYLTSAATLSAANARFADNMASSHGGAIFTENHAYENPLPLLGEYANVTLNAITFEDNSSATTHEPPGNAPALTNITSTVMTSIQWHPLNNRDINYENPHPFTPPTGLTIGDSVPMRLVVLMGFTGLALLLASRYRRHKEAEFEKLLGS